MRLLNVAHFKSNQHKKTWPSWIWMNLGSYIVSGPSPIGSFVLCVVWLQMTPGPWL